MRKEMFWGIILALLVVVSACEKPILDGGQTKKKGFRVSVTVGVGEKAVAGAKSRALVDIDEVCSCLNAAVYKDGVKQSVINQKKGDKNFGILNFNLPEGTAYAYSIDKLQDRGKFFIDPGEEVYAGQVVGEHVHDNDLVINVTKAKQLTNVRASGSDEKARVIPKTVMSLEECLEYIKEDEYVEVTPKNMRMRKILLDHLERKRANKD